MAENADTSQGARQRMYYCKPCKVKHSPPTGARCRHSGNGSENEVSDIDDSIVQTRTATQPEKPAPKKRGRKPKVRTRADTGESRDTEQETPTAGASSHDAGMQLILKQLQSIREEAANARESDRQTTQKALDALARRIEAPVLSSEEEDNRPVREKRGQRAPEPADNEPQPFARPAKKGEASRGASITPEMIQDALDPIARLKGDKISSAQAQLIMSAVGVQDVDTDQVNVKSGYYRTLADIKKYHVPWPNDTIYRSNGKKALYDTLTVPEFVVGYCNIIASTLKVGPQTAQAFDHLSYLIDLMSDVDPSGWEIVKGSHRQILHMAETGQIKWENAEARNTARGKHVTRAEKEANFKSMPMGGTGMLGGTKTVDRENLKGRPCQSFQNGRCLNPTGHFSNGQQWAHVCATCLRVSGQRNEHPETDCRRKKAHDSFMAKAAAAGKINP